MIRIVLFLAFVFIAVVCGYFASQLGGTITLSANDLTKDYQMNVWLFILYVALAVLALYVVIHLLFWLMGLRRNIARMNRNRAKDKAGLLLEQGMMAMGRGDYRNAEKHLLSGVKFTEANSHATSFYWSAAAMAANQQGAEDRRDQYLLKARESEVDGEDTFDSKLTEARLFLDVEQPERALAALRSDESRYLHPQVLSMKLEAFTQQKDFESAWKILPNLRGKVYKAEEFAQKQGEVASGLFKAGKAEKEVVSDVWHQLPNSAKRDETTVLNYVNSMINHNDFDQAEDALAQAVRESQFSDTLVQAYGQLNQGSSTKMLNRVEDWLGYKKDSARLNFAAAKLAFRSDMLDKAEKYATESLKYEILPESYALLGEILKAKGEDNRSLEAFRKSAGLTYFREASSKAGDVLTVGDVNPKLADKSDKADTVNLATNPA